MARKPPRQAHRGKGRSFDQRDWNATMGRIAKLWEWLHDEERLVWNVAGKSRRQSGYNYFIQINARRARNGEPPVRSDLLT